jgi:hypothetical protein
LFVQSVVDVRADDAASLATAESLITDAASNGHIVDEVMWTIGLARWLLEGDARSSAVDGPGGRSDRRTRCRRPRAVRRSIAPDTE